MVEEIRAQLQAAADGVPAGELSGAQTRLDEIRAQLDAAAGQSSHEHMQQAIQLTQVANEKVTEALQAVMQAAEHARNYAAML